MEPQFQLLPDQASTMAPRVDALFWFIFAVCAFFTVGIAILLIFFAVRYRRVREDYFPTPLVGSKILEVTWSVIPLGIVMVMFFWGLDLYFDIYRPPENSLEIYVTGKQWMWHLQHPGGQREINALHVPIGRPVKLILTSEDVIHDFSVPAFRVKMDAVPGRYTYLWFEATKTGTYHLFCAQYCGTKHSEMIGSVVVMAPAEYEEWLAGYQHDPKGNADRSLALQGRQLFQKLQCVTCHHPEAGNRAPNLVGLAGRRVEMDNGQLIYADDSYLRQSIHYPGSRVRAGWKPIMPSFKNQISEDDMIRLLSYIKSLRPGDELPSRVESSDAPEAKTKKDDK